MSSAAVKLALTGFDHRPWPVPALCFAKVEWGRFLRELGAEIPVLQDFAGEEEEATSGAKGPTVPAALRGLDAPELEIKIGQMVQGIATGILGVDDLSGDAPLMEAGLDSLSSVDFRNSVAKELPGVKLPSTLMFDHPTTKAIATFASEQLASVVSALPEGPAVVPKPKIRAKAALVAPEATNRAALALTGASCRFPLEGTTPLEMWEQLTNKTDGIVEIPLERWDVDAYFDEDAEVPGMMTVRHGGFVKNADCFDASFFGLSPAESKVMDPQQRLLLEVIYQSFHASGKLGTLTSKTFREMFLFF
eukprot:symbB.v1.2.008780.t1/scaffold514.1/size193457/6